MRSVNAAIIGLALAVVTSAPAAGHSLKELERLMGDKEKCLCDLPAEWSRQHRMLGLTFA